MRPWLRLPRVHHCTTSMEVQFHPCCGGTEFTPAVNSLAYYRIFRAAYRSVTLRNQDLALIFLLSPDGEALRRLADEGRLNEWAEASVGWAKE